MVTEKNSNQTSVKPTLSSKWSRVKWSRPEEFSSKDFLEIFNPNKEISPTEIKQGALGNCYFLSVLAALAEYPERIKPLFLTQKCNEYGIYGIKICKDGEWKEIVIDDHFPCDKKRSIPCFSSSEYGTLWVPIIEKCYAKAYGSYYKIEGGIPEHAIRDLTGAPTITLDNSYDNLLNYLKEACAKKWIITASAGETEASKDLLKEVGLIPMNAYTILEVNELPFDFESTSSQNVSQINSNIENLLKIRNPWGKNEWIGDWSDFSNLWRDDLKKKLNYSNSNGCFYMNFKDFKHYFSKIQICKVQEAYEYKSIKIHQPMNSYSLIKLKIDTDKTLDESQLNTTNLTYISLIQQDKKNFNHSLYNTNNKEHSSNKEYKYSIGRFILSKINDDGELEYISGKMGQDREIFDEKELESGEYIIFVEIDWFFARDKESTSQYCMKDYPVVISSYSRMNVELSQVNNEEYPEILQRIYRSCAKKQNNVLKFTSDGAPNCLKYL
jgi:calpain-15